MANTKISQLPTASALTGSELVPIVQAGITRKTTLADMPYVPDGVGAVTRTAQAKMRETLSASDRGSPVNTAVSNVVADIKAVGGGSFISGEPSYTLTSGNSISITGGVAAIGAIAYDHKYAPTTSPDTSTNAFLLGNITGSVAPTYRNEFSIKNLSATGAGKTGTSAGICQVDAADIRIDGAIVRNFAYGFRGESALSSDYRDMTFTENGIGISAIAGTGLTGAEPNALRFHGVRVYGNDRAVSVVGGPNAAMLWEGCNFEGNNLAGNDADGRAVVAATQAGEQVFICTHHEGNLGQYGTYFQGADFTKTITMLGVQHIDGTGTGVHIEAGSLLALGSRIYSASATHNTYLQTGASATLIESETTVTGDVSNLASIRFGKLGFGQQPVRSSPCITANNAAIANASGNVVSQFESDIVIHKWQNTAGANVGYVGWYNAFDTEYVKYGSLGFAFYNNGSTKVLNIGRAGNVSVEPGTDNSINLGSGALRWKEVFSTNATINTSDARLKTDDRPLSEKERAVAVKAKGLLKAFRLKDSIAAKGDKARIHFGVYAQELKAAFESEGLVAEDYAVLCYDEWDEIPERRAEDGTIKQAYVPAGNQYGIRYEELLAFIIAAL